VSFSLFLAMPGAKSKRAKTKADSKGDQPPEKKVKQEEEQDSPAKVKSVVIKGQSPPVDEYCTVQAKTQVLVDEHGQAWSCMLNQTNIQQNNNKFYLIQLLKEDAKSHYYVFMRWGRVGYKGQLSLTSFGADLARAKGQYCQKFRDKTRNEWEDRENFEKVAGKYDLVHMDHNQEEVDNLVKKEEEKDKGEENGQKEEKVPDSKLEERVQELIKLICDVETMEQTMIEMQYDTKKMPLGKITQQQIKAGYEALKRIADIIDGQNEAGKKSGSRGSGASGGGHSGLLNACNDFYTRIPHEFGMRVSHAFLFLACRAG